MRAIIHKIDEKNKCIWIKKKHTIKRLYLSNKMTKTYMSVLYEGLLLDYELDKNPKEKAKIIHINQIISLMPYKVIFDTKKLRHDMYKVLKNIRHYLFIDFEMSMPPFSHRGRGFQTEIIQYGFVLTDDKFNILNKGSHYVFTKSHSLLSDRTLKFLKINAEDYLNEAISYHTFYDILKDIVTEYKPKLVIWGKNDYQVLHESYTMHEKQALTYAHDFIDALKLHKDYYDLKDDLGLLSAYNMYYEKEEDQMHHAYHDAYMTFMIMKAFKDNMKKGL